ncbi:MAG TPA: hypothetical protein DIV86_03560 [Alphaproteobacteria bacterium]|nr:hypothetical protein [Alphaproteobacteria bacterium]
MKKILIKQWVFFKEHYWDSGSHIQNTTAMEGAKNFLEMLGRMGIKKAILTNNYKEFVEPQYQALFGDLKGVKIYDRASKPDKKRFEEALKDFNLKPEQVVKIGDTLFKDAPPAINLGVEFMLFSKRDAHLLTEMNNRFKFNKPAEIGFAENHDQLISIFCQSSLANLR